MAIIRIILQGKGYLESYELRFNMSNTVLGIECIFNKW